jgi:hypothetical protein
MDDGVVEVKVKVKRRIARRDRMCAPKQKFASKILAFSA